MGGSPVKPDSPIIGLLFGFEDSSSLSILDAQEIEYSYSPLQSSNVPFGGGSREEQKQFHENIQTKIELHKMVFPTHKVVGWYRVTNNANGPTSNDLTITNGPMLRLSENPIFLLMNASETLGASTEDEEDELPVSIYETLVNNTGQAAFVNMEFQLETFEPERIAVEKVLKTQPSTTNTKAMDSSSKTSTKTSATTMDDDKQNSSLAQPSSALELQLNGFQSSIESLDSRIQFILEFLYKTQSGEMPPNPRLLRQIQNVISQLPVVIPQEELQLELEDQFNETLILSYVATVAKTTKVIETHAEKFRLLHENNNRDIRGRY